MDFSLRYFCMATPVRAPGPGAMKFRGFLTQHNYIHSVAFELTVKKREYEDCINSKLIMNFRINSFYLKPTKMTKYGLDQLNKGSDDLKKLKGLKDSQRIEISHIDGSKDLHVK